MSNFSPIFEIEFWGVFDPGVPGKERIVFKPIIPINLSGYFVSIAVKDGLGGVRPLFDQAFFFQDIEIGPPAWVFIYTGQGTAAVSFEEHTNAPLHALYWGRQNTIFNSDGLTAVIVRMDGYLSAPKENRRVTKADITAAQMRLPFKS